MSDDLIRQQIRAYTAPWQHRQEAGGPVDLTIGIRSQPQVFKDWPRKTPFLLCLAQTEPENSNFTVLTVLATTLKGVPDCAPHDVHWYKMHQHRRKQGAIRVRIKGRIVNKLVAPLPIGKWEGSSVEDPKGTWALMTIQAQTLKTAREEKPRSSIIVPGDPDFVAPRDYS